VKLFKFEVLNKLERFNEDTPAIFADFVRILEYDPKYPAYTRILDEIQGKNN
jgi:hypothetical protein